MKAPLRPFRATKDKTQGKIVKSPLSRKASHFAHAGYEGRDGGQKICDFLEGILNARINKAQLDQIITYILREYDTFGVQKKDNSITFDKLEKAGSFLTWTEKPIIPFKKILWPDRAVIPAKAGIQEKGVDPRVKTEDDKLFYNDNSKKKLSFLGLTNCDAQALDIFLKEFSHTDLLPKRSDILVITSECKPDENCFCTAFGQPKFNFSDIHIQEEGKNFEIFALTKVGQEIIKENGVSKFDKKLKIREIKPQNTELLDLKSISQEISRKDKHEEYWQKIADQCFACGACTAVCPLCFCFRCGSSNVAIKQCNNEISWDSCYSSSFSQIQRGFDFRPKNSDRLHNWYHHKFSRSVEKNGYPLCTGCGRCISACPANLNQKYIVESVTKIKDQL